MRLLSLLVLGFFLGVGSLWAAPELLLVAPKNIRLGYYATITARGLARETAENQVFIKPQGASEAVSVPVTRVVRVPNSDLFKLTFVLTPRVLETQLRRPLSAELWVVSDGVASNRLAITIIPAPAISEVSPAAAYPGDELDVTIKVMGVRLRPRGLSLTLGPGIEVEDLALADATTLTAHLKVSEDALAGKRDVVLHLGRLVIRGFQLFEVLAPQVERLTLEVQEPPKVVFTPSVTVKGAVNTELGEPELAPPPAIITSLTPATGQQGQRVTISLRGTNTHFDPQSTQLLMGNGITVEDLKVHDETHLEATIYIDPQAETGPRSVQVVTGAEIAPCALAFNVTRGFGAIKGYVKDAETKAPLARVRVSLPDYQLVTYTDEQGYFELRNVPSGKTELYFSLSNYGGLKLDLDIKAGQTIDLTKLLSGPQEEAGIFLKSEVHTGEIPGTTLKALLSQGLTRLEAPELREEAREKLLNALIALGGADIGVLDEDGTQLNPQVDGEGLITIGPGKVEELLDYWEMGQTYSLSEVLYFITNLLVWEHDQKPTLGLWLEVLNQAVNEIWNDQENDAYNLVRFLFTHQKELPNTPPHITADFRFNPLQAFLFVHAFILPYVEYMASLDYEPKTYMVADYWGPNQVVSDGMFLLAQNDNQDVSSDTSGESKTSDEKKFPLKTFAYTVKSFLAQKGKVIIQNELSTDFLKNCLQGSPEGSTVVQLFISTKKQTVFKTLIQNLLKKETTSYLDYLAKSDSEAAKALNKWLKDHHIDPNRLSEYLSIGVPDINDAVQYSGKIMQVLWQPFINMYKTTVIEMATPLPPIIDNVCYHYNESGDVDGLKISFYPSRTEQRVLSLRKQRNDDYPKLFYVLYRIDSLGKHIIAFSEFDKIPKDKNTGLYYFIDRSAPLGIVRYRMIAIAKWRRKPLNVIDFSKDTYYNWVKGFAPLPSTTVLLPLMEDIWSAYAQVSIYFYMAQSTFSNEYSFYNNPYLKVYARIDVDTPPFDVTPYEALVSISNEGKIYQLKDDGSLTFWADVNFASPYQKGLAIDTKGWAYTENAASESKFAGKIFAFVPENDRGVRLDKSIFRDEFRYPWLGTIRAWSYFGLQSGFIYPVYMADLCYGFMPLSDHPEGLFILEQSFSDIRFLPIDGSSTVAKPLNRINSQFPEVFPINEFSRCVYNWEDGNLYFSSYDEIKKVNLLDYQVDTFLSGHLEDEGKRRLLQISGFAFDKNGLVYLTDSYLQEVYLYIPYEDLLLPLYSLKENQATPLDLAISPDKQNLLVATNRGLYILPKLVPYQVISQENIEFQGILNIEIHRKDTGEENIPILAKQGYLLAPIYETTSAFYRDPTGKAYLLFFDADSYCVWVRPVPSVAEGGSEEVQIKPVPPVELEGALNYVVLDTEGGATASCLVPQLPFEGLRFIKVLAPVSGMAVAPNFHLYAVVSRGISKVEVLLDYRPYREINIDPETGGCLDVSFEGLSPGRHVVLLKANEAGLSQVLVLSVTSSPTQKVLAGVVAEAQTGFPLQGLVVEDSATGQKTTVDLFGIYRLVLPQEAQEHLILRSPE